MPHTQDPARVRRCRRVLEEALLARRNAQGYWTGDLSSSALSTATAVMALHVARAAAAQDAAPCAIIERGLSWLIEHQNADGGWGDTPDSPSNIATTMLCRAALHAAAGARGEEAGRRAAGWIDHSGGQKALEERYGKDRTFSVPIQTHAALAGLFDWCEITPLPFELACVPSGLYRFLRLPVVSYALPALVAMGQARHHHAPSRNPLVRAVRNAALRPALRVAQRMQPASGGFLEATPLTSFVAMSLASSGQAIHPIVGQALRFLRESVRADGSWPIDTNLSTWVTTLSINALQGAGRPDECAALADHLIAWQLREPHPYTNADPGGWAWTNLSGGVPDADDTAGALLALHQVRGRANRPEIGQALARGARWLLGLQNRDGGWPTFCRGWGALPFDRSAPDLTAHALRALWAVRGAPDAVTDRARAGQWTATMSRAIDRGFAYLAAAQQPGGAWIPLWFGNQRAPREENPVFGTARVLAAYRDCQRWHAPQARRALAWLCDAQNADGGWGGDRDTPSTFEETSVALEALCGAADDARTPREPLLRGLNWLLDATEGEMWRNPSPIGLYFAKLWYSESLYPIIFGAAALRRAAALLERSP